MLFFPINMSAVQGNSKAFEKWVCFSVTLNDSHVILTYKFEQIDTKAIFIISNIEMECLELDEHEYIFFKRNEIVCDVMFCAVNYNSNRFHWNIQWLVLCNARIHQTITQNA